MTDVAKKQHKRWGKKYVDKRDWPVYNRQLVKRGEFLLDLDWVESWDAELSEMNECKLGHPYMYPESLIKLQAVWHTYQLDYRTIEGITKRLCEMAQLPAYNNYTTVNRRVNQLDISFDMPVGEQLVVFSDGTGFQAIEGGEYLRHKYGKKNRRWIQVIILGDPETKEPVSFEVNLIPTSEPDSAQRQLDKLTNAGVDIKAFGGDGGFDKLSLWKELERQHIQPIIKSQKNARDDTVSKARNKQVKTIKKHGYTAWANEIKYGTRWPATEGIFSAIKRIFGEHLAGKSELGMVQETKMKIWTYKTVKQYGEA